VEVENYLIATSQISQTALRSVLGKAELDQLLADRERLNEELQKSIDESTEPWGVKVTAVEIKDVEIPDQMQRAMARQAEAERERRGGRTKPHRGGTPSASGGRRSSTPRASSRRRRSSPTRPTSSAPTRPRCSCATCRRCSKSAPIRTPRWSSRWRWMC